MNKRNKPIGIFDSGVGGLTILKELKELMPNENIVYLGDNGRNPYGSKSKVKIREISKENTAFLLEQDVKMVVIACNTASAVALYNLRDEFDLPIVGVINAGVRAALSATKNNKIGVIGTRQTISSKAHEKLIKEINPKIEVFNKATPILVQLVEENMIDRKSTKLFIKEELEYFKEKGIDTLILGCTHFPLLKEKIKAYLGDVNLVDPSHETSRQIEGVLSEIGMDNDGESEINRIFVTDRPLNFMEISRNFLGSNLFAVEKTEIESDAIELTKIDNHVFKIIETKGFIEGKLK